MVVARWMMSDKVKYMPPDKPGEWKEGKLESNVKTEYSIIPGLDRSSATVRDEHGEVLKDVTVIPPDKK